MTTGIYQILNTANNKRYIGSSIDVKARLREHRYKLNHGKHVNPHLSSSWVKYGKDNFLTQIILECRQEDLLFYEDLIIKGYKSNQREFGYNTREVSGSNAGMMTSANSFKAGDKFQRLTLIKPIYMRDHNWWWLCSCECGNTKEANPCRIRSGQVKSCGCAHGDRLKISRESLVGLKFNRLTLIKESEVRGRYQRTYWLCRCDCGTEKIINLSLVRTSKTKSCGCWQKEQMSIVGKSNRKIKE